MFLEDFSGYLNQRPGNFFFIGCGITPGPIKSHHKPDFEVDERCLEQGVNIWVNLIKDQLFVKKL